MLESLKLSIVYDDEDKEVEPYYRITCTDQNNRAIELINIDIFNTYEEAQQELENILKRIKEEK